MLCKMCKISIVGRSDKKFCSIECKNNYHFRLRKNTETIAKKIDVILHRNRSILLELLGKDTYHKKLKRLTLAKKKFNFKYMTHYNVNKQGKIYHHVYDFAWMEFSDDQILIVRRKK